MTSPVFGLRPCRDFLTWILKLPIPGQRVSIPCDNISAMAFPTVSRARPAATLLGKASGAADTIASISSFLPARFFFFRVPFFPIW